MKFLESMNRFMFTQRYSVHDVIWISIIGTLAVESLWWFLLLIPMIWISVHFERRYGAKSE